MICSPNYSGDQIKDSEMGRACGMYGGKETCIQGFGGDKEGNMPLRRPRHRWEDNTNLGIHSYCYLSYDRSIASSKASSPKTVFALSWYKCIRHAIFHSSEQRW
jgi:hypothetical protein